MYNIILAVLQFGVAVVYSSIILTDQSLERGAMIVGLGFVALAVATGFQLLKGD